MKKKVTIYSLLLSLLSGPVSQAAGTKIDNESGKRRVGASAKRSTGSKKRTPRAKSNTGRITRAASKARVNRAAVKKSTASRATALRAKKVVKQSRAPRVLRATAKRIVKPAAKVTKARISKTAAQKVIRSSKQRVVRAIKSRVAKPAVNARNVARTALRATASNTTLAKNINKRTTTQQRAVAGANKAIANTLATTNSTDRANTQAPASLVSNNISSASNAVAAQNTTNNRVNASVSGTQNISKPTPVINRAPNPVASENSAKAEKDRIARDAARAIKADLAREKEWNAKNKVERSLESYVSGYIDIDELNKSVDPYVLQVKDGAEKWLKKAANKYKDYNPQKAQQKIYDFVLNLPKGTPGLNSDFTDEVENVWSHQVNAAENVIDNLNTIADYFNNNDFRNLAKKVGTWKDTFGKDSVVLKHIMSNDGNSVKQLHNIFTNINKEYDKWIEIYIKRYNASQMTNILSDEIVSEYQYIIRNYKSNDIGSKDLLEEVEKLANRIDKNTQNLLKLESIMQIDNHMYLELSDIKDAKLLKKIQSLQDHVFNNSNESIGGMLIDTSAELKKMINLTSEYSATQIAQVAKECQAITDLSKADNPKSLRKSYQILQNIEVQVDTLLESTLNTDWDVSNVKKLEVETASINQELEGIFKQYNDVIQDVINDIFVSSTDRAGTIRLDKLVNQADYDKFADLIRLNTEFEDDLKKSLNDATNMKKIVLLKDANIARQKVYSGLLAIKQNIEKQKEDVIRDSGEFYKILRSKDNITQLGNLFKIGQSFRENSKLGSLYEIQEANKNTVDDMVGEFEKTLNKRKETRDIWSSRLDNSSKVLQVVQAQIKLMEEGIFEIKQDSGNLNDVKVKTQYLLEDYAFFDELLNDAVNKNSCTNLKAGTLDKFKHNYNPRALGEHRDGVTQKCLKYIEWCEGKELNNTQEILKDIAEKIAATDYAQIENILTIFDVIKYNEIEQYVDENGL